MQHYCSSSPTHGARFALYKQTRYIFLLCRRLPRKLVRLRPALSGRRASVLGNQIVSAATATIQTVHECGMPPKHFCCREEVKRRGGHGKMSRGLPRANRRGQRCDGRQPVQGPSARSKINKKYGCALGHKQGLDNHHRHHHHHNHRHHSCHPITVTSTATTVTATTITTTTTTNTPATLRGA